MASSIAEILADKVSDEQKDAIQKLYDPNLADPYLLLELKQARIDMRNKLEIEKLQPYADKLYEHLYDMLKQPGVISKYMAQLVKTCTESRYNGQLSIPVFTFNAVHWNESLDDFNKRMEKASYVQRCATLRKQSTAKATQREGEWDAIVYELAAFTYYDRPARVERVLKKTDCLTRLALRFGPNFRFKMVRDYQPIYWCESWTSYPVTIHLEYYPEGLPRFQLKTFAEVAMKYKDVEELGLPLVAKCVIGVKLAE